MDQAANLLVVVLAMPVAGAGLCLLLRSARAVLAVLTAGVLATALAMACLAAVVFGSGPLYAVAAGCLSTRSPPTTWCSWHWYSR
jgi:hypothetical protein